MTVALLALWLALQVTPDLKQHVEAGMSAQRAGDLDGAIREFRQVTELAPGLAAGHVNLGAAFCQKKDYAGAIAPLKRALEIDPSLLGAQQMLGLALLASGYPAEAIPHLETAHEDGLLGIALLEAGRAREALAKLEGALEKRPGDPDLMYYLGQAHARLSQEAFSALTKNSPDSARALQFLGDAALAAGDRAAAEKHLRAALNLRPDLRGVHYSLGEMYLTAGDYERAEPEFREESKLNPGSAAAAYKLGFVLLNRGEIPSAITALQRANGLQPGMPETLLELGKATAGAGDLKSAERFFRESLTEEKDTSLAAAAHFQLAQLYQRLGRAGDAEVEMKRFNEIRHRANE